VLIANKVNRIRLDQYHRDCEEELETATDSRERRQLRAQAAKMLHQAAEMLGELPTRSTIELESAPTLRHIVEGWSPDKWAADLRAGIPAPVDDLAPAPVVTEPSTDGETVDRLFRAQPSPASNDGPPTASPQSSELPSKLEKIATNLVAKVRADGMLRLDELAPGLAQERFDEVLAFVLSRQWLALRGTVWCLVPRLLSRRLRHRGVLPSDAWPGVLAGSGSGFLRPNSRPVGCSVSISPSRGRTWGLWVE
jgi:hypothetical protein